MKTEEVFYVMFYLFQQICDSPKLFVEGASAGDVTQGRLGNCWFVAASSCLALYKELWNRVCLLTNLTILESPVHKQSKPRWVLKEQSHKRLLFAL